RSRTQGPLAWAIRSLLVSAPEARANADQARAMLRMAQSTSGQPVTPGHTALYPGGPNNPPTRVTGNPPIPGKRPGRGWLIAGALLVVAALPGGFAPRHGFAPPAPARPA